MNEFENNNHEFNNDNLEHETINQSEIQIEDTQYSQGADYSQTGGYAQDADFSQSSAYSQESGFGQNAGYSQTSGYGQDSQNGRNNSGRYSYQNQGTDFSSGGWNGSSYSFHNSSDDDPKKSKRKRRKKNGSGGSGKKWAKLVASAAVFGIVAGACFVGVSVVKEKVYPSNADRIETTTSSTSKKDSTSSSSGSSSSSSEDISTVVDNVMPSVVSITSKIQTSSYYGYGTQESEGAGSGFIIAKTKKKLMIATNNHVVSDATSLTVGFVDDTTASATIVGQDSSADLAVISVNLSDIKDSTASKIKVATLGSSDDLKVGENVIAIGNALGYGQSVTTGVISAKNREVSFTDGTMTLLQTDAAINPGNSGGVLVNMSGQVIGINNAKLEDTSVEGMGYAIPISTANSVLEDLMNAESVSEKDASFLGIVGKTIDSTYSEALGIPSGIYVSQVVSGSPAEKAGISAGDVITKFEGNNVSTMEGLKEKLALKKANTKVKITYERANQSGEYEEKTVSVTLGKKSDFADVTDSSSDSSSDSSDSSNSGNSNGSSNGNSGNSSGNSGNSSNGMSPYEYFFGNGNSGNDSGSSDGYYYNY